MRKSLNYYRSHSRLALATLLFALSRLLPLSLRLRSNGKTRVLVFHHLDEPEQMQRVLSTLAKNYRFISFADYLSGRCDKNRLNIIIACDDGYLSWHTHGLPLFRRFGVEPLLFINTGFVNLTGHAAQTYAQRNILTRAETPLNWDQIRDLRDAGAEIGGHSCDHANLTVCTSEQLNRSIGDDRQCLLENLGPDIRSFAYPFGLHNAASAAAVQASGYSYAFTSESGFLDDSPGPYLLQRSNLGLRSALTARAVAEGYADCVSNIIRWIKSAGCRVCART